MTDTFKPGDRVEFLDYAGWQEGEYLRRSPVTQLHEVAGIGGFKYWSSDDKIRPLAHTPTQEEREEFFTDTGVPGLSQFTPPPDNHTSENAGLALAWRQLAEESRDIFFSRHKKYGPRNIADAPGGALNGVVVRMHDKMARLRNFIEGDKTEYSDESIHDTLIDISNYANIARLILKDQWPS